MISRIVQMGGLGLAVFLCGGCSSSADDAPGAVEDSSSLDASSETADTTSSDTSSPDTSSSDTTSSDAMGDTAHPAESGADSATGDTASDVSVETSDASTADSTWQVNAETPLCRAKATCTDIGGLAAAYQFNVTGFCPTNSQVLIAFHHNADGSPPTPGDYTIHPASSTLDLANVPAGEVAVRVQHVVGGTTVEQLFAKSGKVVVKKSGTTITASFVTLPTNVTADTVSGDISCF